LDAWGGWFGLITRAGTVYVHPDMACMHARGLKKRHYHLIGKLLEAIEKHFPKMG